MNVKTTLIGGPLDGLEIVIDQDLMSLNMPRVTVENGAVRVDDTKHSMYVWSPETHKFVHESMRAGDNK